MTDLNPDQMTVLRGRRYNRAKKAQGAPKGNNNRSKQSGQNVPFEKTAERLAKEHGVDERTIRRDGKIAA
jgi:hypothetical protein